MVGIIEDISAFLASKSLGVEAVSLWCYNWGIKAVDNGICITQGSGPPPKRFLGDSSTLKESHLTILIRNTNVLSTIPQSVYDALDNAIINGYISCVCEQPEPLLIDKEETITGSGLYRYYFSINIELKHV